MKKTLIAPKPSQSPGSPDADAWVNTGQPATRERTKRLTLDVRESLHRRIKVTCAAKGEDMADELRRILEEKFPEQS